MSTTTSSTVTLGRRRAEALRAGNLILTANRYGETLFRVAEVRPLANGQQVALHLEGPNDLRPRPYVYDRGDLFDVVAERT